MGKRSDQFVKTPETLKKAILTMRRRIEKERAAYLAAPLVIPVEMGDGRIVDRANPFVQEYRALVRDYSTAMKAYKDITEGRIRESADELNALRSRFKVTS